MSISQNFPDEGPSLNLNFASSRTLDPRITFTRTSIGTYTNKNGLVTIAPTDTPRFDHSYNGSNVESLGLLIEESRTNLALQSQSFNNSPNTTFQLTVSADATTAPDATLTADKLVENTANSSRNVYQSVGTISGNYTVSCFLKAAGRYKGYLQLYNNSGGNAAAFFDLNLGTITASTGTATITPYPNGWYRVTASANFPSDDTTIYLQLQDNSGNSTYTGDGSSGLFVWGIQVEAGAFPTSYIPTVASTVTRSADNASMTGTNFSSWYNSTAATGGTVFATARRGYSGNFSGYPNLYRISDGTSNNVSSAGYGADAGTQFTNYGITTGGVNQTDYAFTNISTTNLFKTIHTFATNSSTFCVNGSLTTTDTSVTLPSVNILNIGQNWNGTISSLSYYPTRLTNSQLQNLTK